MKAVPENAEVHVRMLAFLHAFQRERGEPASMYVSIPDEGLSGRDLALAIGLPLESIEGLFLNAKISDLGAVVRPGDRVAFVPYGTPASHPAFFGPFKTRG